jgi:RNA polymerase sigma factor (sigma-70 family)
MKTEQQTKDAADGDTLQAGSTQEGLSVLFRECDRALRSFLRARLGSEHEAQEVAQESYARLLQLHRPDALSHPKAYLFKIAGNVATDRIRQRITRARLDELDVETGFERVDTISPDQRALAKEELDLVERALGELPPKYRRAFLLNRFESWTTAEIAKELFVRERMVRNYIARTAIYCQLRLEGVSRLEAWQEVMP